MSNPFVNYGFNGTGQGGSVINSSSLIQPDWIIYAQNGVFYALNPFTGQSLSNSDAATLIQDTLDLMSTGILFIKAGTYNINTTITIPANIMIMGAVDRIPETILQARAGIGPCLSITAGNNLIQGLNISSQSGQRTASGDDGILMSNASRVTIKDCFIAYQNVGIHFTGTSLCWTEKCELRNSVSAHITIDGAQGEDQFFHHIHMDTDTGNTHASSGFDIQSTGGFILSGFDILRTANAINIHPGEGGTVQAAQDIFCSDGFCDSNDVNGVRIYPATAGSKATHIAFVNCWMSSNTNGINANQGTGSPLFTTIKFSNCVIINNKQQGVILSYGQDMHLIGCTVSDNSQTLTDTYDEIEIYGISFSRIIGCSIGTLYSSIQGKYGINITGGTLNQVLIEGNTFVSPGTSAINNLATAGSVITIKDNAGYNPIGVSLITVGTSPFTYTNNDYVEEMIYISGGTVSAVTKNGITIFSTTGISVMLYPGESLTVTYSAAPTMNRDRK